MTAAEQCVHAAGKLLIVRIALYGHSNHCANARGRQCHSLCHGLARCYGNLAQPAGQLFNTGHGLVHAGFTQLFELAVRLLRLGTGFLEAVGGIVNAIRLYALDAVLHIVQTVRRFFRVLDQLVKCVVAYTAAYRFLEAVKLVGQLVKVAHVDVKPDFDDILTNCSHLSASFPRTKKEALAWRQRFFLAARFSASICMSSA